VRNLLEIKCVLSRAYPIQLPYEPIPVESFKKTVFMNKVFKPQNMKNNFTKYDSILEGVI